MKVTSVNSHLQDSSKQFLVILVQVSGKNSEKLRDTGKDIKTQEGRVNSGRKTETKRKKDEQCVLNCCYI